MPLRPNVRQHRHKLFCKPLRFRHHHHRMERHSALPGLDPGRIAPAHTARLGDGLGHSDAAGDASGSVTRHLLAAIGSSPAATCPAISTLRYTAVLPIG